jgi:multidrug efflux pump subunit AcrA (membrane-fusion protein)
VVGASVSPAAAPFTIVRLGALDFVGEVDEADIDTVEAGMRAEVLLDSFPDATFETEVARVDAVSRTTITGAVVFPAHLPLRETGRDILIGMQGSADIEVAMIEDVITVPIEALFDVDGEDVLYVLDGDTVERRVVEVGRLTETDVEIVDGVDDGEEVALTGAEVLEDGMVVRVVEPDDSTGPGGFGGPFGG